VPVPSWQEMRDRSTRFVLRWQNESRERGESQSFWDGFFHIFDVDRRRVAVFEHLASRHSTGGRGFMDVFWPGYMAGEQKSRGADLGKAMEQALDYLPSIPPEHLPRLVVVSDFARFKVRNQLTGEEVEFPSPNSRRVCGSSRRCSTSRRLAATRPRRKSISPRRNSSRFCTTPLGSPATKGTTCGSSSSACSSCFSPMTPRSGSQVCSTTG